MVEITSLSTASRGQALLRKLPLQPRTVRFPRISDRLRPTLVGDLILAEEEGTLLARCPSSAAYFAMNETMAFILSLCDGNRDVVTIAGLVAEVYGIDPNTAHRDVVSTMQTLLSIGFVEGA